MAKRGAALVASGGACNGRNGVVTSSVDLLGRTVSYTDVWAKTSTSGFDQAGQVTQRTGPNGTETYEYTSEGQLWKHKLGGTVLATLSYNTGGELRSVAYANGTGLADLDVSGRRFDDRGVRELTFTGPSGTITSNAITGRDRNGRVVKETVDGKEYRYSYDAHERLITTEFGTTGFSTPDHSWQYCYHENSAGGGASLCQAGDVNAVGANGNRVAAYRNGVKIAGYAYDSADRLTGVSIQTPYAGNPIAYDARGNTTAVGGEALSHDGADRHMTTSAGANTVAYQRDLLDRIVGRVGTDGTTRYTYGAGGDTSSAVLDGASGLVQTTISLPGGVLLTKAGGTETWSYPNIQGSVVAVANAVGVKQGVTFFYDPFGNSVTPGLLPDNSAGNLDYGYLGQHQRPVEHNTGLRQQTEMGARGYDSQLGRFLETDPIEGGVDNDYTYVTDPIAQADLSGETAHTGNCGTSYVRVRPRGEWAVDIVVGFYNLCFRALALSFTGFFVGRRIVFSPLFRFSSLWFRREARATFTVMTKASNWGYACFVVAASAGLSSAKSPLLCDGVDHSGRFVSGSW